MAIEKLTNAQLIFGILHKRHGLTEQQLAEALYGDGEKAANLKGVIGWMIKENLVKEHEGKYFAIANRYPGLEP